MGRRALSVLARDVEAAGFRVIEFDRNDDQAARTMGHLLGWDQGDGGMDLEHDLFAWYTLVQRPK